LRGSRKRGGWGRKRKEIEKGFVGPFTEEGKKGPTGEEADTTRKDRFERDSKEFFY